MADEQGMQIARSRKQLSATRIENEVWYMSIQTSVRLIQRTHRERERDGGAVVGATVRDDVTEWDKICDAGR